MAHQAISAPSATAVQSMLERGLIEIRPARIGHAAFLTETGLAALRLLVLDTGRTVDPNVNRRDATGCDSQSPPRRRGPFAWRPVCEHVSKLACGREKDLMFLPAHGLAASLT